MTYKIQLTIVGKFDLEDIYSYIRYHFCDEITAKKVFEKIRASFDALTYFPYRFRKIQTIEHRDIRLMSVDSYGVLFVIDDEEATVKIIRIIYSGRDIDNIVQKIVLN